MYSRFSVESLYFDQKDKNQNKTIGVISVLKKDGREIS